MEQVDYTFERYGSIYLCQPQNDAAWQHLLENVRRDAQWYAGALAVDHRCVGDLRDGLSESGYACGLIPSPNPVN